MIKYIYTIMLRNRRLALRTGSTIWRNIFSARPGPDLGFTRNRTGFSAGKLNAAIDSAAARTNKQQWTIGTFHFRTKLGVELIKKNGRATLICKEYFSKQSFENDGCLDGKNLSWLDNMEQGRWPIFLPMLTGLRPLQCKRSDNLLHFIATTVNYPCMKKL